MHPKYIVWLQNDEGNVVDYELFFSGRKAEQSYKRALKIDEHGWHNSPLKKALLTGFHSTAKHNATKAVSPSSETMRTI